MESSCVLLEGILARQRELHTRAAELVQEQAAMDASFSPRKLGQRAFDVAEDKGEMERNGTVGGGRGRCGDFTPSLGMIDQTFLFAMVWGLGGGLTGDPALAFDIFVRDLVQVSHSNI